MDRYGKRLAPPRRPHDVLPNFPEGPRPKMAAQDPPLFYKHHVFCCTNTRPEGHPRGSCSAKGSEGLRNYMKARAKQLGLEATRINASGCLDRCELGPTMVIYPEGVWYHYQTTQDLDEILDTHLVKGGRVERLMLMPDQVPPEK